MLITGCVEREFLSEKSSLEEYEEVVDKIANGYEMVVIAPAYLAGSVDDNTISNLRGYIHNLYRALHLIDDIRDVKEDSAYQRANYMNFFRSIGEAKDQGTESLESSSRYIRNIERYNYHKEYLWWISKNYFKDIISKIL